MIITATAAAMGRSFLSQCVHIGATFVLMERTRGGGAAGGGGGWFDSESISVLPLIRAVFYT